MKIWQGYCKVTDVLVRIGLVIGGIAVCAAAALVTVDVFLRGIFNVSTMIADEYSCYFCVAMTFFGGAMAYRQGSFINVDIFYAKIKPEVRKWLDLVLNLIGIAFVIFLLSKACISRAIRSRATSARRAYRARRCSSRRAACSWG